MTAPRRPRSHCRQVLSHVYPGEQILWASSASNRSIDGFCRHAEARRRPRPAREANRSTASFSPAGGRLFVRYGSDGPTGQPFSSLILARVKVWPSIQPPSKVLRVGGDEAASGQGEFPCSHGRSTKSSRRRSSWLGGRGALRWAAEQVVERGARRAHDNRAAGDGDAMTAIVDTDPSAAEMLHAALGPEPSCSPAWKRCDITWTRIQETTSSAQLGRRSVFGIGAAESLRVSRPSPESSCCDAGGHIRPPHACVQSARSRRRTDLSAVATAVRRPGLSVVQ